MCCLIEVGPWTVFKFVVFVVFTAITWPVWVSVYEIATGWQGQIIGFLVILLTVCKVVRSVEETFH